MTSRQTLFSTLSGLFPQFCFKKIQSLARNSNPFIMASPLDFSSHIQIPPLEEFLVDVDHKLGRANGNIYHRHTGIPSVHDGQIMVRLKKKRFVILDYGLQPSDADLQYALTNPHIKIPKGAGKESCKTPECPKVGVPVCIYDSEPNETDSLYLRTGLCFSCQRNLNEKRRTERKRTNPRLSAEDEDGLEPSMIYAMGPSPKKLRYKNGSMVELASDAIIVNGAIEGTRHYGEGYGFQEIGGDLLHCSREALMETERLIEAVSSGAASAAVAAVHGALLDDSAHDSLPPGDEEINSIYQKAFHSLSKSIFLLTQWKASWDAAIEAAHETVADPSLADAVASAAAVAAATTVPEIMGDNGSGDPSSNMATLLMAANDERNDHDDDEEDPSLEYV